MAILSSLSVLPTNNGAVTRAIMAATMSDYPWVIDEASVVHHSYCMYADGALTPYGSLATTDAEMIESLRRPDVANKHSAPSLLQACPQCILGKELDV